MSFIFFIIATFLFVKGYRDADTALNLYIIEHYTGVEFVDVSLLGREFTLEELYRIGLAELFFSFIFFLLSVGFAVIVAFELMDKVDGEKCECRRRSNTKLDKKKGV
jgi:hypothetical protein